LIDEKEKRRKEKVGSYVKVYRSKLYSNNKKHDPFKVKDAERKKRERLMATCHSSIIATCIIHSKMVGVSHLSKCSLLLALG